MTSPGNRPPLTPGPGDGVPWAPPILRSSADPSQDRVPPLREPVADASWTPPILRSNATSPGDRTPSTPETGAGPLQDRPSEAGAGIPHAPSVPEPGASRHQGWAPSGSEPRPVTPAHDTETTAEARLPGRPGVPSPSSRPPERAERGDSDLPALPAFPGAQPWEVPEDDTAPYDWFAGATDPEHRAREAAPDDVMSWAEEPPVPYATEEQVPWESDPKPPTWEPPPGFTAAAAGMQVWPAPVSDPPLMPPWPAATGEPLPGLDGDEAEAGSPDLARPGHPAATTTDPDATAPHAFDPNATSPDPVASTPPRHPTGSNALPGQPTTASSTPGHPTTASSTPGHPTTASSTPPGQPTTGSNAPAGRSSTPKGGTPFNPQVTAPDGPHPPEPGDIPVWPPAPKPSRQADTGPMPVTDALSPPPPTTPPATSRSETWPPPPHSKGPASAARPVTPQAPPPAPPPEARPAASPSEAPGSGIRPDGPAPLPVTRPSTSPAKPSGARIQPTESETRAPRPEIPGAGSDASGPLPPASPSGSRPSVARSELRSAASRSETQAPGQHSEATGADTQPSVVRAGSWPPAPQTEEQRQEEQLPELPFSPEVWGQKPVPARGPVPLQSASYDLPTPPHGATAYPQGAYKQPAPPAQPTAIKEPGKSKQALFATLGVLVLAGVATGGFFAYKSLSTPPPPVATATQQPAPTVSATSATSAPTTTAEPSAPAAAMLNSEDTDPRKLSLSEAFPKKKVAAGGADFARVKTNLEPDCEKAAAGPFADALKAQKCNRVLRATYVDAKRRYAVTTGIAVLPTRDAALRADETKNLSRNLWFRALPGPAGTGGERVHIAGGYAAGLVWGRYIVFSYATYADGHTPAAKDKTLGKVSDAFRDQMSLVLERRIANG
ncbi:hypothetical protein [Nonomuraea sp. NPDC048916]|uniref:hypothetical protein n=1 Tax=Nonomuraea sp. NPDC048916 TaxID=3154232 RepID=UPI0033DEF621